MAFVPGTLHNRCIVTSICVKCGINYNHDQLQQIISRIKDWKVSATAALNLRYKPSS